MIVKHGLNFMALEIFNIPYFTWSSPEFAKGPKQLKCLTNLPTYLYILHQNIIIIDS